MEKSTSYYDWELQFRKHPKKGSHPKKKEKKVNSLACLMHSIFLISKERGYIFILERLLSIVLIISMTIFVLDSIPYLFLDEEQISFSMK